MNLVLMLSVLAGTALSQQAPRHVQDLGRNGFLALPAGSPPELTAVAGARFIDLVPDSQKEVCRILLEHQARITRGLYRLRVVDGRGNTVLVCSL